MNICAKFSYIRWMRKAIICHQTGSSKWPKACEKSGNFEMDIECFLDKHVQCIDSISLKLGVNQF